ncbi:MAG TPA: prenyltransferase/squalene oxidase repeat-containing protein, partial [Prosthecobacter sp.]|nr:prenyltransferase/squalene oxidase repeat-containing protein [Prosthecobacter sp.]
EVNPTKYAEWLAWSEPKVKKIDAGLEGVAFMVMAMAEKTPAAKDAMEVILTGQEADGSWKPAGQLGGMQKRSNDEARENATRLHLLALDALDPKGVATVAAREKAAKWVGRDVLPESVEALIFRALYARRFGEAEKATALRTEILQLQHEDGGWAWSIKEVKSDPLATGQVLHLLSLYEDKYSAADMAVKRAQAWLIGTQREDGAWSIDPMRISKTDRSGEKKSRSLKNVTEIYEFWGTVWATIGLLQGVPVVEAVQAKAP